MNVRNNYVRRRGKRGSRGTCPQLWLRWGNALQLWPGLNVAYTTKFLESFYHAAASSTGVRMHQIRFAPELCPDPAGELTISRLRLCIATYGHLTSEAYHVIILTCSPSFTLAALHHLIILMCIRCAKLVDVQLRLRGSASPTLVWNKCCLYYKILWIFATIGHGLQASECTKFVLRRGSAPDPAGGAHDAPMQTRSSQMARGHPLPIPLLYICHLSILYLCDVPLAYFSVFM